MLPLLQTMLTTTAESLNDLAGQAGWMEALFATMFDPAWNQEHATVIWPTIMFILALTGIGLPTPEDIWLTLAGFSAYKQGGDEFIWYYFLGALFACSFANLVGDTGAWFLGRKLGFGIRDRFKFMRRILTEKRLRKVQGWFDNYGNWTVFLGRQVAGIRFVTFFSAGTMRMPLPKFLLFDFLGCMISIPIWLTLGALSSRCEAPNAPRRTPRTSRPRFASRPRCRPSLKPWTNRRLPKFVATACMLFMSRVVVHSARGECRAHCNRSNRATTESSQHAVEGAWPYFVARYCTH